MTIRLNTRIIGPIDFTVQDEALLALVDMVKCTFGLDVGEDNVIFNNQCYDNEYFEVLHLQAVDSNESQIVATGFLIDGIPQ